MLLHLVASIYIVMLPVRSQQNASNFWIYWQNSKAVLIVLFGTCIDFGLFFKISCLVTSVQKCDLLAGLDELSNVLNWKICGKNLKKLTLKNSIAFFFERNFLRFCANSIKINASILLRSLSVYWLWSAMIIVEYGRLAII